MSIKLLINSRVDFQVIISSVTNVKQRRANVLHVSTNDLKTVVAAFNRAEAYGLETVYLHLTASDLAVKAQELYMSRQKEVLWVANLSQWVSQNVSLLRLRAYMAKPFTTFKAMLPTI